MKKSSAAPPLLITTPIYYVNDVPHIGHAYTTIAADVIARHHRAFGRRVFFLTGTDEHGLKVQKAAAEHGIDPKRHCDETVERFISLWKKLGISNDGFIRTTDPEHIRFVQDALTQLKTSGEIEPRDYEGFYCVPCERFWTDKDLQDNLCPDCQRPVERLTEKNYFFGMGRRREAIREAIRNGILTVWPDSRKNEVLGFLEQPLSDLCISRPKKRLAWGILLPFDSEYVTYVWFDALLNYMSALTYSPRSPNPGAAHSVPPTWEESEVVHLIGKDILTTHSVYWPAMLMGLGWKIPARIVAHGWWTVEGKKMSKSLGNVVDPNAVIAAYGADAFRFFLLREVPFGQDGDFSTPALVGRINHDLADEFGNLVGRIAALVRQKENGEIDLAAYVPDKSDGPRASALRDARQGTESFQFSAALTALSGLFSHLNKRINDEKPWQAPEQNRRETLSSCAVDLARGLFLLAPYTPNIAALAADRLGCGSLMSDPDTLFSDEKIRASGTWTVKAGPPLVEKIIAAAAPSPSSPPASPAPIAPAAGPNISGIIDITEFQNVELRTAKILSAERVAGSDKLIKLSVQTGPGDADKRQVVAGIGKRYSPESLAGKTVVIVANLKPRKIFGQESHGMILAAGDETTLNLLTLDAATPPGLRVK